MKLKDFIELLEQYDPQLDVFCACAGYGNLMHVTRDCVKIEAHAEAWGDKLKPILAIIKE